MGQISNDRMFEQETMEGCADPRCWPAWVACHFLTRYMLEISSSVSLGACATVRIENACIHPVASLECLSHGCPEGLRCVRRASSLIHQRSTCFLLCLRWWAIRRYRSPIQNCGVSGPWVPCYRVDFAVLCIPVQQQQSRKQEFWELLTERIRIAFE